MRFVFGNPIHWRRHLGGQEKLKAKLWKQGIPPLTTIIFEVFLLLAFYNLQVLHHNNQNKKEKKGFVTIVIENTPKVISVLRRNYFTQIILHSQQEKSKEEDIHQEPTPEKEEMNLTISCKALAKITTPQTLKIEGHIKKFKK